MTSRTPHAALTFADFLKTPPGHLLARWTLQRFDLAVDRVFGAEALQIGAPQLDTLRANRMQGHALLVSGDEAAFLRDGTLPPFTNRCFVGEPECLPIASGSIDLVTMPHALDFSASPQQVLREAARVLAPEGRLILSGFNPAGLWWMRQRATLACGGRPYLPTKTLPIPLPRLRDWFALLGLEIDRGAFGIYVPGFRHAGPLQRWGWMDKAGDRWAPHCSNLMLLEAVKREPGVTPIGKASRLTPRAPQGKMPVPTAGMNASHREAAESAPELPQLTTKEPT